MDIFDYDDNIDAADAELIFDRVTVHCPHCEIAIKVKMGNPTDLSWYDCPRCGNRFWVDWSK